MSMIRYQPNDLFEKLQRELLNFTPWNRELANEDRSTVATSEWIPRVDIIEEDHQFLVRADIPGVDPKDIEISMNGNTLTVRGERKSETKEESKKFTRVERLYGTFYRQFTLPDSVVGEQITAKSKHGVLEIAIPKEEKAKPRTINVAIEE
ncbi:MAG TPA: Hsp20/alpha crystallin family protein [Gammaproteobacteria bacterium]|nr:Hsp20/alpha crystallin family protein [Gammaproteobacteria bacterium]